MEGGEKMWRGRRGGRGRIGGEIEVQMDCVRRNGDARYIAPAAVL